MTDHININLHGIMPQSRANGPGIRFVIWFQGCTRNCPGCFNPKTHTHEAALQMSVASICAQIAVRAASIEGVTISGGEPFEQPEALLELVRAVRASGELSILVFSGYTVFEIARMPLGPSIMSSIDVLIAGPYNRSLHNGHHLLGSANQRVLFLTSRYCEADIACVPESEVVLSADGTVHATGVAPLRLQSDPLKQPHP